MISNSNPYFGARPIWIVLLIALVARAALPLVVLLLNGEDSVFYLPDSFSYIAPAKEVLADGTFTTNGRPEVIRTPGYPLLLIPGILLGHLKLVTITLQVVISCFTVYLVFRTALLLFGDFHVARRCALLYAFEPLAILYASKLLSETVFTAALCLSVYFLFQYLDTRKTHWLLLSSVALSGSAYIRPIVLYLAPPLAILLAVFACMQKTKRAFSILSIFAFVLVFGSSVGLWRLRNQSIAGYTGFSAIEDHNLYFYQAAAVIAAREGLPLSEVQQRMRDRERESGTVDGFSRQAVPRPGRFDRLRREAKHTLAKNWPLYCGIHLKGMAKTLLDPEGGEYLKIAGLILGKPVRHELLRLVVGSTLGLLLLTQLVLVVVAFRWGALQLDIRVWTILYVGAYLLFASGGAVGYSRFRHPIMPMICLFAGYGMSFIRKVWVEHWCHRGEAVVACARFSGDRVRWPVRLPGGMPGR